MSRLRAAVAVVLFVAACARNLPAQDRRITTTATSAKMSVEDLWKDYQADAAGATRRYHGKAVEISGNVTDLTRGQPANGHVFFALQKPLGVRADLLDDQAQQILSSIREGQRVTLKCFCEGLDGNLVLKSCIRP